MKFPWFFFKEKPEIPTQICICSCLIEGVGRKKLYATFIRGGFLPPSSCVSEMVEDEIDSRINTLRNYQFYMLNFVKSKEFVAQHELETKIKTLKVIASW